MNKALILIILGMLTAMIVLSACSDNIGGQAGKGGGKQRTACTDGLDNDGDGFCDFAWRKAKCTDGSIVGDSGCSSKDDNEERDCGDGVCQANEDCASCAADCGSCSTCGDGTCDASESCSSCSADCGSCPPAGPVCGDGACDANETCGSCSADCGSCPPAGPVCGDNTCDASETCSSCPGDCGSCPPGTEMCSNQIDDDSDGYVDEADSDCAIALTITPNPINPLSSAVATVTAADGGLYTLSSILIRSGSCSGSIVCTASALSPSCNFFGPSTGGSHVYFACVGGNTAAETLNVAQPTYSCSDSDGGFNVFTKGTVSGTIARSPYSNTDSCVSGTILKEWICAGNLANSTMHDCSLGEVSTGCSLGACI